MCGIFGFITQEGEGPQIARLRRIALITQSRGEHAFGLAWVDSRGAIQTFKAPGSARDWLDELDRCRQAQMVIGHCRWATHGSPADNRNNHPHPAGSGYLVHNGVVQNHRELIHRYDLRPQSECDSEVLGLLMARCPGSLAHRAARTAHQACGDLAILGVWRRPARLVIVRRGRPLHFGQAREGFYFGSLPDGLPVPARQVIDRSVHVATFRDGGLHLERTRIDMDAIGCPQPDAENLQIRGQSTSLSAKRSV